ncbi:MAG: hypothetical protein PHT33_09135, partial [bacterium]|nr:hypothetical protein [bacterium]
TDTQGQREIMSVFPDSGIVYTPGDHRQLACNFNRSLDKLPAMKNEAWNAARMCMNWEIEKTKLIEAIGGLCE